MFRAAIFDFDGVIADSEPLHYEALNVIFNGLGINVTRQEHWDRYLGYTDYENIEAVSRDYGLGLSTAQIEELILQKAEVFDELVGKKSVILDGVEPFVAMLTKEDISIGICSGALKRDIDLMLDGSPIRDSFSVMVTADEVQKGKPDPEGYNLALQRLNHTADADEILPAECVVIEDSRWGLQAARSAGMNTIAVTTTYSPVELEGLADLIVENLSLVQMEQLKALCSK